MVSLLPFLPPATIKKKNLGSNRLAFWPITGRAVGGASHLAPFLYACFLLSVSLTRRKLESFVVSLILYSVGWGIVINYYYHYFLNYYFLVIIIKGLVEFVIYIVLCVFNILLGAAHSGWGRIITYDYH